MALELLNGTGLYINGEWRARSNSQSGSGHSALDVHDQATGHLLP
jgi:hypothetical protein